MLHFVFRTCRFQFIKNVKQQSNTYSGNPISHTQNLPLFASKITTHYTSFHVRSVKYYFDIFLKKKKKYIPSVQLPSFNF